MNLTTRQAADKLKVEPSYVLQLIKKGALHNVSFKEGLQRQRVSIDSKEINEMIKNGYRSRMANHQKAKQIAASNGDHKIPIQSPRSIFTSLHAKLERIESKIEKLEQVTKRLCELWETPIGELNE